MAYFEWSDELSVNVKAIDDEHRKLVEMIDSLYDAMLARRGRNVQKKVIDAMVDYAGTHFATEERYMRKFAFPTYDAHRAEHEKFTAKALDLKVRADRDGFILTLEIVRFLKDWLSSHIMGTDKQYMQCFSDHGLE